MVLPLVLRQARPDVSARETVPNQHRAIQHTSNPLTKQAPLHRRLAFRFAHDRSRRAARKCSTLAGPNVATGYGLCMESVLEEHARRALERASSLEDSQKYVILIAGSPGSGKTTSARVTCRMINELAGSPVAVVASMDGFHYYRHQLDAMGDPAEAHAKRGAHWTFDAPAFVAAVKDIRDKGAIAWPSFDHAVGDPVPEDVQILPEHKVVLVEGNYVLMDEEPWSELKGLADEAWFISCDIDTAMERVVARQVGNGSDVATAEQRVADNDRPNAELVQKTSYRASHVILSILPYRDPTNL